MSESKRVGDRGENLVRDYLVTLGYQILVQKWQCPYGEIDLIATNPEWLIFVEVKTRSARNWDNGGLLAIAGAKQQKLLLSAQAYLAQNLETEKNLRFDVALVARKGEKYYLTKYLTSAFTADT